MKMDNIAFRLIDTASPVTVFIAKKVITINPDAPFAECVATQNSYIVAIGNTDSIIKALATRHCTVEIND